MIVEPFARTGRPVIGSYCLRNVCVGLRLKYIVMTEQKYTLPITGMTCANCAANIERGVKKLEGVTDASVNFAAESAAVSIDPQQLQLQDVVEKIHNSGFGVTTTKLEMPVTGMTCANCAANIERALNKKTAGVVTAGVNFATEGVSVG